ncbi:hypothetical protein SEA_FRANCOB_237 [Streptomyces phage Francob]
MGVRKQFRNWAYDGRYGRDPNHKIWSGWSNLVSDDQLLPGAEIRVVDEMMAVAFEDENGGGTYGNNMDRERLIQSFIRHLDSGLEFTVTVKRYEDS